MYWWFGRCRGKGTRGKKALEKAIAGHYFKAAQRLVGGEGTAAPRTWSEFDLALSIESCQRLRKKKGGESLSFSDFYATAAVCGVSVHEFIPEIVDMIPRFIASVTGRHSDDPILIAGIEYIRRLITEPKVISLMELSKVRADIVQAMLNDPAITFGTDAAIRRAIETIMLEIDEKIEESYNG